MHIRELFTVPEGKRVTEKAFGRVLLSSICGMLLCMACLTGTTWAWFAVSIENKGNEIQIATVTATVSIRDEAENAVTESADGKYKLDEGTYGIGIRLDSDATESKSPVYVVMSVTRSTESKYYYFAFENGNQEIAQEISVGSAATIGFTVSWVKPVSAVPADGEVIVVREVSA